MWGALVLLAGLAALYRSVDPQSWFHLAAGRSILAHGWPAREIWVLGARGQPSWLSTWLFDVALRLTQMAGGDLGLALWRAGWAAAAMALAIAILRIVGAASWSAVLLAPLVLAAARPWFEPRPEAVAVVLLLLGVLGLESARAARDRTRWLIPLQALWANVHPGWVSGPVVVWLYALAEAIRAVGSRGRAATVAPDPAPPVEEVPAGAAPVSMAPDPPPAAAVATASPEAPAGSWARAARWATLGLVLLGASALVPNPLLHLALPLRFLGDGLRDPVTGSVDLRPWTLQGAKLEPFNVLLALSLVAVVVGARRIWRASPGIALLAAGLVTLTLCGFRLRELTGWVLFVPLALAFTPASGARFERLRHVPAAFAALAGAAALALTPGFVPGIHPDLATVPVRATALADSAGFDGPVLNSLSAGGYILWTRGDRHPPLMDARGLGSFELRRLFAHSDSDPTSLDSLQEAWGLTHAILRPPIGERDRLALNLSRRIEWALVFCDDAGLLFVRYSHAPKLAYARAYRYYTPDELAMLDMIERIPRDPGLGRRLEAELLRARRESPLHGRASYWLGFMAQDRKDAPAAAHYYEEATALAPDLPGLALRMGMVYETLDQRDQAIRAYRRAAANPDDRSLARSLLKSLEQQR